MIAIRNRRLSAGGGGRFSFNIAPLSPYHLRRNRGRLAVGENRGPSALPDAFGCQ
jgi:hypothetical protein